MILNAVICVWNEEDIIESTVKHAFAQGCSNVYIIDNASTDGTVERAEQAGAVLAGAFESKYFDEIQKITHLNSVVRKHNAQSTEEHVWWLYLDADEFPNIDHKTTIADFLKAQDSSIRAVHGFLFEHLPTHPPYYVGGRHPADFMPLAGKTRTSKVPLLRYDRGKEHLYSGAGAHSFDTRGEWVAVAEDILNIHHFNYRRPENSLGRLAQLTTRGADGTSRVDKLDGYAKLRANSSDALSEYHSRRLRAKSLYGQNKHAVLTTDELQYTYGNLVRWYDPGATRSGEDTPLSLGVRHFFLENYDAALGCFQAALERTNDQGLRHLLSVKMAVCLSFANKEEALRLLRPFLEGKNKEIREYAARQVGKISEARAPGTIATKRLKALDGKVQQYCGKFEKRFFLS
ncbi:MAG: glycosyltransferase family 2 protein [Deltaproteobacteria bacterium]|jgi:glycosyltransferase involved in cell wall biosynthesis|nr:glycosyltransferase family 2 protein [Deltaproteobacteria bacterium]